MTSSLRCLELRLQLRSIPTWSVDTLSHCLDMVSRHTLSLSSADVVSRHTLSLSSADMVSRHTLSLCVTSLTV